MAVLAAGGFLNALVYPVMRAWTSREVNIPSSTSGRLSEALSIVSQVRIQGPVRWASPGIVPSRTAGSSGQQR